MANKRTMDSVSVTQSGLEVVEVLVPIPEPEEVLIKVELSGLCGSDLHRIRSVAEGKLSCEYTLGHEIVGRIDSVGASVSRVKVGDRVVVNPLIPCRKCEFCLRGVYQNCKNLKGIGKNLNGGYAEYVAVPELNVFKIDEKMPATTAVLFDDIAVSVHARNMAGGFSGKSVAVVGDGALGITVARLAVYEDAARVVVFGPNSHRVLVGAEDDTFNDIFDVVFEAVGGVQSESINKAIQITAPRGKLLVLGVYPMDFHASILARVAFYKELSIIGVNSFGVWNGVSEVDDAIKILKAAPERWSDIVGRIYPLKEFPAAVSLFQQERSSLGLTKIAFSPEISEKQEVDGAARAEVGAWPESDKWELASFIPTNFKTGDTVRFQGENWEIVSLRSMGRLHIKNSDGKEMDVFRWYVKKPTVPRKLKP